MADASISAEPENIRFSAVACHTEGVVRNCHPKEAGSQMTWNSMDDVVCCHAVAIVAANHDKLGQGSYADKSSILSPRNLFGLSFLIWPPLKRIELCNRKLATKPSHLLSATGRTLTKLEVHWHSWPS